MRWYPIDGLPVADATGFEFDGADDRVTLRRLDVSGYMCTAVPPELDR